MKTYLLFFAGLFAGFVLILGIASSNGRILRPLQGAGSYAKRIPEDQPPPRVSMMEEPSGHLLTLLPAIQDFGRVKEGAEFPHTLVLHAPDDTPLWLGRVHSPCPCILLGETPPLVPAGRHVEIPLRVKTEGLSGDAAFPVYVQVIEPEETILRAEVRLHVKAAVAPYRLDPAQHDFGTLREGEARSLTLTLHRPAGTPLRLGRLHSPCPCVTVRADATRFAPEEVARIHVDVHSLTLAGDATFPVYVSIREPVDEILAAVVRLHVERVPTAILLEPDRLEFGMMEAGAVGGVRLLNLTKEALQVEVLDAPAGVVVELVPAHAGGVEAGTGSDPRTGGTTDANPGDMESAMGDASAHAGDSGSSGLGSAAVEGGDVPTNAAVEAVGAETPDREEAAHANVAAGGAIHVRVRVADSLPRGAFRGEIRLATTHPMHAEIHLPVMGFVR